MANRVRITGSVPAGLPYKERVNAYAEPIDAGLRIVAGDPGMRLAMILGESVHKLRALIDWLVGELEKDEHKAPGLIKLARKHAYDPKLLAAELAEHLSQYPEVADQQQFLIEAAIRTMENKTTDDLLQIEGEVQVIE